MSAASVTAAWKTKRAHLHAGEIHSHRLTRTQHEYRLVLQNVGLQQWHSATKRKPGLVGDLLAAVAGPQIAILRERILRVIVS